MRYFLYGYRYGEVPMPPVGPIKESAKISPIRPYNENKRSVVGVSSGVFWHGGINAKPDISHPITAVAGVRKRFCVKPPVPDPKLVHKLRKFTRRFLKKHVKPLSPDTDLSLETWLSQTNYPESRKEELRRKWNAITSLDDPTKKYSQCKSFIKDEFYTAIKHARAINSRSDEIKCFVGPIFKAIETVVYGLEHNGIHPFIKHVPVAERPNHILAGLAGNDQEYIQTDYTAFESLFVNELIIAVEAQLYAYMTQLLVNHNDFMLYVINILAGVNKCQFKFFSVVVEATRMSGEMCTSLGNGFANYIFMQFVGSRVGATNIKGYVEGDDGLFTMKGRKPSPADFEEIGLIIKLEVHHSISHASFCGILFDEYDRINITDPIKVLLNFGWSSQQYATAKTETLHVLLRAKALSYAYQYPGCPVIWALCEWILRKTHHLQNKVKRVIEGMKNAPYEREQLLRAFEQSDRLLTTSRPTMRTRLLMYYKFNLSPRDQLMIEEYFVSKNELGPYNLPLRLLPSHANFLFRNYVQQKDVRLGPRLNYPAECTFPKLKHFRPEFEYVVLKKNPRNQVVDKRAPFKPSPANWFLTRL